MRKTTLAQSRAPGCVVVLSADPIFHNRIHLQIITTDFVALY